jgi:hypothetical protein
VRWSCLIACIAFILCSQLNAAAVAIAGPFEFHSDFWVNLHHFLYEQASQDGRKPAGELTSSERAAWNKALDVYRQGMVRRDLIFDERLRTIDTELAEDEGLSRLALSGPDAALLDMLNTVAPIYRAHWWTTHDQANRKWIAAAVPLTKQFAPQLTKQLAAVYETLWPRDPVRVDLAEYANWAGAYTYTYGWGKVHEIISSMDPANQGYASLEMLFHEATHGMVPGEGGRLADQIARVAKASGVRAPKDLVHIFIFYTAGELTRRDLAGAGVRDYVPYADKKRLYGQDWAMWHDSMQVYWKQHLDGSMTFDDAVNKIVASAAHGRVKR